MSDQLDWVAGEDIALTVKAITFFTATVPKIELDIIAMRYLVTSEGYRNGPAGP